MRNVERTHAGNEHTGADVQGVIEIAVIERAFACGNAPMARGFVPGRFAKARLETDVRSEPVALHAGFQVLPDLLLARAHAGPIGIRFKLRRIGMTKPVASD